MTEPQNAWKTEWVSIIMDGLKEYNPEHGMCCETITINMPGSDDQIEIGRPDNADRYFYEITYLFSSIKPYGHSMDLAMYNEEEFVVKFVRYIIEDGGMTLTDEQMAEIQAGEDEMEKQAREAAEARRNERN